MLFAMPGVAYAECRASPSGTFSYDLRLSPRAGRVCLRIVDVHSGSGCQHLEGSVELACNETNRLLLTDRGQLVSILAPRAQRPDWRILRVTTLTGGSAWIRLRELPLNLRGSVRLDFDGARLRARSGSEEAQIGIAMIEAIAERSMRRDAPR